MHAVVRYTVLGFGIVVMVLAISQILPPPHCDLLGNCLPGYEHLTK